MSREKQIIRTSLVGILANLALAGFKAAVGLLAHSIAIVLDAVNNLSDALSSVITVIGARLAGKPADKEHPYGHGRYEYISAAVISALVLYAGITALVESVRQILRPEVILGDGHRGIGIDGLGQVEAARIPGPQPLRELRFRLFLHAGPSFGRHGVF